MHVTDLGSSPFYNDIFLWDDFYKRKGDHLGHFFRRRRVQQLIKRHELYLLKSIFFTESDWYTVKKRGVLPNPQKSSGDF